MSQLYDIAAKFLGVEETPGAIANPAIMAALKMDNDWPQDDAVPWCSAAMNAWAHIAGLPRSKSLRARSWLQVGTVVPLVEARRGDVVILNRAGGSRNPSVIAAPGHVTIFSAWDSPPRDEWRRFPSHLWGLGGNQGNKVSVARYPVAEILGVRRLEGA